MKPALKREHIASFIRDLYGYYVATLHPGQGQKVDTPPELPEAPSMINSVLVEDCHAVAAELARAVRNKCASIRII